MKSATTLIGSAFITVLLPFTLSAEIGTGPESIMGFGLKETPQLSITGKDSQLTISKLSSPFLSPQGDNYTNNRSFSLDYIGGEQSNSYHFSLINRDDDFHGTLGFSFDLLKLSTYYGNSDGILSSRLDINGVSPNFFHGAVSYDFDYGGSTLGISLIDNFTIHGGGTFINAEGLENRSVYYSGFSYKNFYSNFSSVMRSSETVGYSFVTGFKINSYDISYQELNSYNDANWREATIGVTNSENLSRVRLSLGIGNNDLHEAGEESRAALMISIPLGKIYARANRSSTNNDLTSDINKLRASFNKLQKAGVGAVGSGVALSSGNAALDTTPRFRSQHNAAYHVLYQFNPISVRQNREYGSSIYQNRDKTFSPNRYVYVGNHESVNIRPYYQIPYGTRATAIWHTHGAYMPQYANEQFSPTDIQTSVKSNLDGYLGTPFGRMRYFNVDNGNIYTFINEIGNEFVLPN